MLAALAGALAVAAVGDVCVADINSCVRDILSSCRMLLIYIVLSSC